MRLQRKLKKRIKKVFGSGTYKGIIRGCLYLERWEYYFINKGVMVRMRWPGVGNEYGVNWFMSGQRHPYLTFKKIQFN